MVISYVSTNAFVGDDHQLTLYSACGLEQMASATFYLNSVCNNYVLNSDVFVMRTFK
jgi:hypothetical protein